MSISEQHTIWCDKCVTWVMYSGSARQALRMASREGWKRKKNKSNGNMIDLCPDCCTASARESK